MPIYIYIYIIYRNVGNPSAEGRLVTLMHILYIYIVYIHIYIYIIVVQVCQLDYKLRPIENLLGVWTSRFLFTKFRGYSWIIIY